MQEVLASKKRKKNQPRGGSKPSLQSEGWGFFFFNYFQLFVHNISTLVKKRVHRDCNSAEEQRNERKTGEW